EADAHRARIEVAQTTDVLWRRQKLGEYISNVEIAEAEFQKQTAVAHLSLARANAAGARAKVDQVTVAVRDAEVRAPFDRVVAEPYLDVGATVATGSPIARIISADDLRVRFAVPEAEAGSVRIGQPIVIDLPAIGVRVDGEIETVAPEIDPASRMLVIEGK